MPVWRNQARNAGPKGPERPRPFPSRLISCEANFSLREILRFTVSQFPVNAINREPTERSEVINHSQKWNASRKLAGQMDGFATNQGLVSSSQNYYNLNGRIELSTSILRGTNQLKTTWYLCIATIPLTSLLGVSTSGQDARDLDSVKPAFELRISDVQPLRESSGIGPVNVTDLKFVDNDRL